MFRKRDDVRELCRTVRELSALLERQTDRILHLVNRDFQPTPRDTATALEQAEREPAAREPYLGLPEAYPD